VTRKAKPARGKAYGILNPFGDLWTYDHFPNEGAARLHVADFWRGNPSAPDLSLFKVVPVRVTVSVIQNAPRKEAARNASPQGSTRGQQ